MTDNGLDENISLEDALRIIMRVPPAEACDDRPSPDGDDVVDADEESEQGA